MKKIVSIVGTRADIIKMSVLIHELNKSKVFQHIVLYSNQHNTMGLKKLKELEVFGAIIVKHSNGDANKLSLLSYELKKELKNIKPFLVLVHGDTLTAISGALAAYTENIYIAHVEAGLRSGNLYSPYPEEMNRTLITRLASLNLCPTDEAYQNLLLEGISKERIYLTGNTIVDVVNKCTLKNNQSIKGISILVTTHRRESWSRLPEIMCKVIKKCLADNNNVHFTVLSHPNPIIFEKYNEGLANIERVTLIREEKYKNCINHIYNSTFVATDSCGIQEEASILGKPTLILRNETERPESLDYGCAILCGSKLENIYLQINRLINDKKLLESMKNPVDAFGDGTASIKIKNIIEKYVSKHNDVK